MLNTRIHQNMSWSQYSEFKIIVSSRHFGFIQGTPREQIYSPLTEASSEIHPDCRFADFIQPLFIKSTSQSSEGSQCFPAAWRGWWAMTGGEPKWTENRWNMLFLCYVIWRRYTKAEHQQVSCITEVSKAFNSNQKSVPFPGKSFDHKLHFTAEISKGRWDWEIW